LKEGPEASESIRETTEAIFTLSELIRLAEIRLEELERAFQLKGSPDVIDDREISVLIDGKRGESR